MANGIIVRAADRADLWVLTDRMKLLLDGSQTAGVLGLAHVEVQPGTGTPPHVHARDDEGFYILHGEVTFLTGDRVVRAKTGQFIWAPRGTIHNFTCTSADAARMVLLTFPAAFMQFAVELSVPVGDTTAASVTPQLIDKLMALTPKYGINMHMGHALPTGIEDAAGNGKRLWVLGEQVTYLATAAQTGGNFTVVDITSAPGGGPPPHAHTREDEVLYVIAGRHEVVFDDRTETLGPGDVAFMPRGTRHCYRNIDPTPGRLLSLHTPGGFEAFFDEVGIDATAHATAPQVAPPPPQAMAELLARHGMTG